MNWKMAMSRSGLEKRGGDDRVFHPRGVHFRRDPHRLAVAIRHAGENDDAS